MPPARPPPPPPPLPGAGGVFYRNGLSVLRLDGETPGVSPLPHWLLPDPRSGWWIAPGHRLPELRRWAAEAGIPELTPGPEAMEAPLLDPRTPRPYQREALERWLAGGGRGTVVLPTGAGKTLVALMAVERTGAGACVVAPTRALLVQWFGQLADAFGGERVGAFYGDEKEVRPVTVTTYWTLHREETLVHLGDELLLPDFTLRHRDGREVLVELVGFWTPEYLEGKLRKLRRAGIPNLVLVVSRKLAAGGGEEAVEEAASAAGGEVVWFSGKVRARPVLEAAERVGRRGEA